MAIFLIILDAAKVFNMHKLPSIIPNFIFSILIYKPITKIPGFAKNFMYYSLEKYFCSEKNFFNESELSNRAQKVYYQNLKRRSAIKGFNIYCWSKLILFIMV